MSCYLIVSSEKETGIHWGIWIDDESKNEGNGMGKMDMIYKKKEKKGKRVSW